MPELPEVETVLRGIKPHIINQQVKGLEIRNYQLRWPIPTDLPKQIIGQTLQGLHRRAKYLLFEFANGTMILHLGMSGRLCVLKEPAPHQKHDHVDIHFANHYCLRFTDPRRFGALLWTNEPVAEHSLLANIGPEPLTPEFTGKYLWERAQHKKIAVKAFIMDGTIVAGVGNIYATEALFQARIHPEKAAGKITREQYTELVKAIKKVLTHAIKKGGTTLKDYKRSDGTPGYFRIELQAYGHAGKPCPRCGTTLKTMRIGQRSTVYCPKCQN